MAPGTLAYQVLEPVVYMCAAGVSVNLALGLFNLLPVPPLDGSNILAYFLPPHAAMRYMAFGRWGFLLLLLLAITGVLGRILVPPVSFLYQLLL